MVSIVARERPVTTGLDLMVARRRAKVPAYGVAARMGVRKQYVASVEGTLDNPVSVDVAERYMTALQSIIDDREEASPTAAEVEPTGATYADATKEARAWMRRHKRVRIARLTATSTTTWGGMLGWLDVLTRRDVRAQVWEGPTKIRR